MLGEWIERNLYGLLETLIAAKYTKNRQRLLEEANLNLEILRFQMPLAKDLQCLRVESYAFAAKSIDEIRRLVVGWLCFLRRMRCMQRAFAAGQIGFDVICPRIIGLDRSRPPCQYLSPSKRRFS